MLGLRASWENLEKPISRKKLTVSQSTVGLHSLPTKWPDAMSNKGTLRGTSFPVFNLVKNCFLTNRQKLVINSPPPPTPSPPK